MTFARNAWYAACWSEDLPPGEALARTILGHPVALWRAEGEAVALEDRCCHRSLPLSMGRVAGGRLRCGYHGLEFDRAGACVKVPGQARIPPGARVRAWPACERHALVWLWTGDPALADEALVPELPWLDDPGWARSGGYLHVKADYRLLVDNLLDLTHVSYLHKDTLAGDPREALAPVATTLEDGAIRVERWMLGFSAPPLYRKARDFPGPVDRWQLIRWRFPSTVTLDIGCADAGSGAPGGDRSRGISMWSNHVITPETAATTHYHWAFARDFRPDDAEIGAALAEGGRRAFLEDVAVLEAQQRSMEAVGGRATVDVNIDKAPLAFRRMLDERIAAEGGA